VRERRPLCVHFDVDVRRAARVVAREDRGELRNAVLVARPGGAKPRLVVILPREGAQQA